MKGSGLTITRPIDLSEAPKLADYDDLDFKYTFSKNRIKWIKNIYPYSYIFLEIPGLIEWEKFQYRGPCQICTINEEEVVVDNPTFNPNSVESNTSTVVTHLTGLASSTKDLPKCIFFGGCVYEILSRKYPNVNLNQFIDPTGDVDVLLFLPKIKILNENIEQSPRKLDQDLHQDSYIFVISDKTTKTEPTWLNSYICALGKWLVESIYNILTLEFETPDKIKTMFPDIEEFDFREYDELKDYYRKPELGFNLMNIHNLIYIASFITLDMYKIQIIMKIGNEIDHVFEFVYAGLIQSYTQQALGVGVTYLVNKRPFVSIDINGNTYNIEEVRNLIEGNLDAYLVRNNTIYQKTKSSYHKALNHVGRLLYLLELHYQNTTTTIRYGNTFYNSIPLSSNKSDFFFNIMIELLFNPPETKYDKYKKSDADKYKSMIYINDFGIDQLNKLLMMNPQLGNYNKYTIIAEYILNNLYFFYVKNSRLIKIPCIDIIIGYNKYFNKTNTPLFNKNYYFRNKLTDVQYQTLHDVFIYEYITDNERIQHNKAAIKIQSFLKKKTMEMKPTEETLRPPRHDTYNPQQLLFEEPTLRRLFKEFVKENLELEKRLKLEELEKRNKAAKKINRQFKTFKFRKNLKNAKSRAKSRRRSRSSTLTELDVPELERSDLDLLFPTRNIPKALSLTSSLTSKSKQNHSTKRKQYNSI